MKRKQNTILGTNFTPFTPISQNLESSSKRLLSSSFPFDKKQKGYFLLIFSWF